ncbi:MAG: MCP four helix bundle domain-containing protein [Desulfobacterales bacterium]|nr:MCP four helix bundle domain-containing protein [Desulfobacterales bacterium]
MKVTIPLRTRIYLVITALVGITVMGGFLMIWYTHRIEGVLTTIIEKNLSAYETANSLEMALAHQKGYLSYYFQDGDIEWLRQMTRYRELFTSQLQEADQITSNGKQRQILEDIKAEYAHYTDGKDQVIALYESGERARGADLHKEVRKHFFLLMDMCEEFKQTHTEQITAAKNQSITEAAGLRMTAVAAMIGGMLLAVALLVILVSQILQPVNRLFEATSRNLLPTRTDNVVNALSEQVHDLLEDMDQTHLALERSRESLLQAEKLAMVGKLAAGMAHSIRNPFTSVQMRLFSLSRSLKLDSEQKEDFQVISEEIRHIDTIVQNFLEFSRPPKLKMQPLSPSMVVDMALQLLRHRLKSYDVTVTVERTQPLPDVTVDPEQLKEVLVNLIINACEAMGNGGRITIRETIAPEAGGGEAAVIQVSDNGPGIPEHLAVKVFQPFFTTKEEGTGLGLSIVERIINEHGGRIRLEPKEGMGASFVIALPVIKKKKADV